MSRDGGYYDGYGGGYQDGNYGGGGGGRGYGRGGGRGYGGGGYGGDQDGNYGGRGGRGYRGGGYVGDQDGYYGGGGGYGGDQDGYYGGGGGRGYGGGGYGGDRENMQDMNFGDRRGGGRGGNFQGRGGGGGGRGGDYQGRGGGRGGDFQGRDGGRGGDFQGRGGGRGGDFQGSGGGRGGGRGGDFQGSGGGRGGGRGGDFQGRGGRGGGRGGDFQGRGGGGGGRGEDFQGRGARGGGGSRGGGRGKATVVNFANRNNQLDLLLKSNSRELGWNDSSGNAEKIPKRKNINLQNDEYCSQSVNIKVNHFPVKVTFPQNKVIYQYRVDIERLKGANQDADVTEEQEQKLQPSQSEENTEGNENKNTKKGGSGDVPGQKAEASAQKMLPTDLRKTILMHMLPVLTNQFGKQYGIITDFSAAMYATEKLETAGHPLTIDVNGSVIRNLPEEADSTFRVKITCTTERVDTTNLVNLINNMKGVEPPKGLGDVERIYSTLLRCVQLSVFTPMRRSDLIDYTKEPHPLGGGIVSYAGYNVQLPMANGWKTFINIEIANMATYMNKPILEVLQNLFGEDRYACPDPYNVNTWNNNNNALSRATDLLKTCKVTYSPLPGKIYTKVVERVCPRSVAQTYFQYQQRDISVYDYFQIAYGRTLVYRDGPCLLCKGGNQIPAEICKLKRGQSFNRKLSDTQTTRIAEVAKLQPHDLQQSINKAITALQLQNNGIFVPYGIELQNGGQMQEISARVLTPPELCYGKNTTKPTDTERAVIVPEDGVWDIWNTEFEFFRGGNVARWGILNLSQFRREGPQVREEDAMHFSNQLKDKAKRKNIVIPDPCIYRQLNLKDSAEERLRNYNAITKCLKEFQAELKNEGMSFVLVILPSKGCQIYNHVKQAAELGVGILTQCIVGKNMTDPRRLDSILGNVLLKINSKLNKINHVVLAPPAFQKCFSVFNNPVLVIGADVTHPPPGSSKLVKNKAGEMVEEGPPSFAAVTCSIDRTMMPYMMHVQAQKKAGKGAAEVITGFDQIVLKFMQTFLNNTGTAPVKIIYFRDGVGDGQFQEVRHFMCSYSYYTDISSLVLRTEMIAMRRACTEFGSFFHRQDYQPKITFVTVQKRHKTRFFMPRGSTHENAQPGTVIDTDIVHPDETDFYLLSHKGLMGTSRPTRYHVLWDDSNFAMNEIQILAYFLCYMFVRCNRAVKIPAPTYYSHWAAKRAEVLSKGWGETLYHDIPELNRKLGQEDVIEGFRRMYPMHFV